MHLQGPGERGFSSGEGHLIVAGFEGTAGDNQAHGVVAASGKEAAFEFFDLGNDENAISPHINEGCSDLMLEVCRDRLHGENVGHEGVGMLGRVELFVGVGHGRLIE